MRAAQGFLTDDGTFFDAIEDAELYDAMHAVSFAVETRCRAKPESVFVVLDMCQEEIGRYLNAKKAAREKYEESASSYDPKKPLAIDTKEFFRDDDQEHEVESADANHESYTDPYVIDNTNNLGATWDDAPIQYVEAHKHESVSNMGSSVGTETLSDDSTLDGTGSGRSDASDICRLKDLATSLQAEIAEARFRRRAEDI